MDKIASFAVYAEEMLPEVVTFFCLVFHIDLLILQEFMEAVCEMAFLIIGTVAILNESPAKFRLLFGEQRVKLRVRLPVFYFLLAVASRVLLL